MPSKPAVVLAHGAWHSPWHFNNVIEKLESAGHEVGAPASVSVNEVAVEGVFAKDVAVLKESIESFTNQGKDVVLVMHSYGGMYGSEAVAELYEQHKDRLQGKGRITHLLYISAVVTEKGVSLVGDENTKHILSVEDGLLHHMEPFYRFYQRTPLPVARQCMLKLRPQAAESFATGPKYRGWADYGVPVTYLICEQDVALFADPCLQKFSNRLRDNVKDFTEKRIDTDHTPWLSAENEFMDVMWEVLKKAENNPNAKI